MARLARLALGGHGYLTSLHGNGGQRIWVDAADRQRMLAIVADQAREHRVAVHGFAVLPQALHLLITPDDGAALSRFMQGIGRHYVRAFNHKQGRRGSLWEGRFRSTLVQMERHALDALVGLDALAMADVGDLSDELAALPPAPAAQPGVPTSSQAHYLGQGTLGWLTAPAAWWSLGNTPFAREAAYARLTQAGLDADTQTGLRMALNGGWLWGDDAFASQVAEAAQRRVVRGTPGRPRKAPEP